MFTRKISKIVKRDGRIINFDRNKIVGAIAKAAVSVGEDPKIGNKLIEKIEKDLFKIYKGRLPTVENVQDVVEDTLIDFNFAKVAKTYILYREKRHEIREAKKNYGVPKDELKLSVNAVKVLKSRYLLRDEEGNIVETPLEMFKRVARVVASIDRKYGDHANKFEEEYFKIMSGLEFIPNSPCLMNAGTKLQQMGACYVLDVPDSLEGIFGSLKTASLIQKAGGGTGFSFSKIRGKGVTVGTTKGVASGPVSFMSIFDQATEVIKQGSRRRGANMGILRVDHPDILDFISCKNHPHKFNNFNISIAVTDKFMEAVLKNKDYNLVDPKTGKVVRKTSARFVFDLIVINSWATGDPGLLFIDRINRLEGTGEKIEATNPCGEQPLLFNESCVLGSINLSKFVRGKSVNKAKLKKVIHLAVRFLDNVIDSSHYVNREIERVTKDYRRIGLGVMGWADLLVMLGIPYDSKKALDLGGKLMKFIHVESRKASIELGKERGNFPKFRKSKLYKKFSHMRNVAVSTIAPTGTISIISGCSSGIEPLFAISYYRDILDDTKLMEINYLFEDLARKKKFYSEELISEISRTGSLKGLRKVPKDFKRLFVTALDIKPEWHVKMQAAFQKYVDNAVSKTVNLPEDSTQEDVRKAYLLAYKLGCKGITVFRYGSKGKQVLYSRKDKVVKVHSEFSGGCPHMDCGH